MNWDRKRIFKFVLATSFITAFSVLFLPFSSEILLAMVVAFAMEPTLGRWLQPRYVRWRLSVALILIAMFAIVALPVTVVAHKTYFAIVETSKSGFQNTEFYAKTIYLKNALVKASSKVTDSLGIEQEFEFAIATEDSLSRVGNWAIGVLRGIVSSVPLMLLSVFIFCGALYFFLAEAGVIYKIFLRQGLLTAADTMRLIRLLQNACYTTMVSSVIIAITQAVIVSIGAWIFDAGDFAVVFVVTFFCAFVPVIGAGPVALSLAAFKVLMGDYGQAIGLGIVTLIAGTSDNLLRPFLMSSAEEDLHPVVSLLAILGALLVFGMPGLFFGPVIASVAVKIIPTLYGTSTVGAKDLEQKET
jgi:predicted PurR-regulated permease PerM